MQCLFTKLRSVAAFGLACGYPGDNNKVIQNVPGRLIYTSIVRPAVDSTIAMLKYLQTNAGAHLRQVQDATQNGTQTLD